MATKRKRKSAEQPETPAAEAPKAAADEKHPDSKSILKRVLITGLDVLNQTEGSIKQMVPDMGLPKDVVKYLLSSTDKARTEIVRLVGREVRDFLSRLNVTEEVVNVLTSVAFEVKAEVRFKKVPRTDAAVPLVKSSVKLKSANGKEDKAEA